jgi:uncharacterized phage-like protein YoqJ
LSFRFKYDAKVWAEVTAMQITLAQPRKKADEVSYISSEAFFQPMRIRQTMAFSRLKNIFLKIPPQ